MIDGTISIAVLLTGVMAFLFSIGICVRVHDISLEGDATLRQKQTRIQSLDPEFKATLEDEFATSHLLDLATEASDSFDPKLWLQDAAREAQVPLPEVSLRETSSTLAGRPIAECSVTWAEVNPAHVQSLLQKAEALQPPLRLIAIDLKVRSQETCSITATFHALR